MAKKRPKGLTSNEERFVEEYLIDLNATAAYRRVHPDVTQKTAGTEGYKFLKKPEVAAAVKEARAEQTERTKVTADKVILELARVAFADVGAASDLSKDEMTPLPPRRVPVDTRRAMTGFKVKRRKVLGKEDDPAVEIEEFEYKFADKVSALAKLGQHVGLFEEKAPLDVVLNALPDALREQVRGALAAALLAGASGSGSAAGAAAKPAEVGPGDAGPAGSVPGDEVDPGPLAAGVSGQPVAPLSPPVLPPGGEVGSVGGEDVAALFDG